MQAISWKLGLFYIATIGLAIGLFRWVSQYGEANLKAQPTITGHYRFQALEMPTCLQGSLLELQQSGRFLNAVILAEPEIKASSVGVSKHRQRATLSGNWWQQIELAGQDRQVGNCFVTAVSLNAQVKGGTIVGTIKLNQENRETLPPASVMGHPTYNNGNPQTLSFRAEKRK